MTITVIGAGYVGLVTAAIFSEFGNTVYCVDVQEERIEGLKVGKVPFFEPGLEEYIKRNVAANRLIFTTSYPESVPNSQIVFICVGTPPKDDGHADLTYLFSALEETAKNIKSHTLITIKSTVPVGFEKELETIVKENTKTTFEFASCPEFLKEGTAIEDSLNPDRIVIGADSQKARDLLLKLHEPLPGKRIICDIKSAQLIKYASNAMLATKISYANAIANICEKSGADVEKVLEGVGQDSRIGRAFLYPGLGYGGSCLPKDVLAFIAIGKHYQYDFNLLKAVDEINNLQIENFVEKITQNVPNIKSTHLAVWGLSFKPNTDDIREAPSIKLIKKLLALGFKITAYDPQAMEVTKKVLPDILYAKDALSALEGKDALVIVTEWAQFKEIDMSKVKGLLKNPIIIDGRNIYDKEELNQAGFTYVSIGR